MEPFAEQIARLAEMSDEEIVALEEEITAAFEAADQAGDQETMDALATALEAVVAEKESRAGGAAAEAAPAEEVVAASAKSSRAQPRVPAANRPVVAAAGTTTIVAGADIPGVPAGGTLASRQDLNRAYANRLNTLRRLSGGDGEQVVIASIQVTAPEERTLRANDPEGNAEKIEKATSLTSITAAGGCCTPLTTRFDLYSIGDTDRPVRNSLPGFNTDRAGIRFYHGSTLADVLGAGAINEWTCDNQDDVDPAVETTWKKCAEAECPVEETAEMHAITMCLTYGVQQSRVFPEMVDHNNKLALVAHARLGEANLLKDIKTGSKTIQAPPAVYGASRDLLRQIDVVLAYYRDVNRLATTATLRAIFPNWVREALRVDLTAGPFTGRPGEHFGISLAEIEGFFSERKVNVTWALESADPSVNGGGFWGPTVTPTPGSIKVTAPTAGGVLTPPTLPDHVEWALFSEGAWLYMDGGTLDLGIIRDSSLARQNKYMSFTESWEALAKVQGESYWVNTPLEYTGMYSPDIAAAARAKNP